MTRATKKKKIFFCPRINRVNTIGLVEKKISHELFSCAPRGTWKTDLYMVLVEFMKLPVRCMPGDTMYSSFPLHALVLCCDQLHIS
ncbi:hypothetical protein I7I53_01699 [Histoplasma capsulatum var. duboisii H88]|uniref:Uncharacterized protein n=1 Tax=Ajellomyces capsulatus (strain H88) TaxID=544711 RepID=A0A8A1LP38_AJEC8|nr:hypothetical protein I7I53_01699 [Histoplasma capsulatum var. duboisii H88]